MSWSAPWVTVEIGYGSTWQTEPGSITWTDETAKVLVRNRVSCRRGASSARGKVDVGTAEFSLKNGDRRFDPTHATGDLFGNLLPGTPVRLLAWPVDQLVTVDGEIVLVDGLPVTTGTSIELWSGTVPSWPQRYDKSNRHAWCPISAYDRFDKLSRAKIPRSVMESVIMPLEPVGYWPLDDPSETRYVTDVTGNNMGTVWDEPDFGSDPLAPGLGSAVTFDGVNDRIDIARAQMFDDPLHASLVCVLRTQVPAESGSAHVVFMSHDGNSSGSTHLFLYVHSDGTLHLSYRVASTGYGVTSATTVDDGESHIVFAQSNIGSGSDYGIGIDSATLVDSGASVFGQVGQGAAIGGTPRAAKGYDDNYFEGSISNVAVFDTVLTTVQRQSILDAFDALDGQTSDERIAWILDEIGWPAGFRDLSTGRSVLGPATFKPGDGALEYLRLVESTEDGRLFVGPDGSLTFHDRYFPYLETVATVSQFTFTDQDGDQGYAEFQLDLDDELLVNVARFSRRDGAEQVATDSSSIAAYGEAEEQRTNLLSTTDAQVRSLAEWAVSTKSTPLPRVPSIRIPLHRYSAVDQATVLALDLGHRVTVNRTPQGVGAEIDLEFLVEGMSHDIGFNEWWVNLFVSPVPQDSAELFLLGSSELGGTHILAH